ncbi:Uncharacterised protein [Mycobacterium tuberculosis]|nr:Uncharacterised protein [Mycobacterium tuberculosis]
MILFSPIGTADPITALGDARCYTSSATIDQ